MLLSINQCCGTSCCASFHSGDPNQVVPFVLYTVPQYTTTHTLAPTSNGRSLFCLQKWRFSYQLYSEHFIGYNLASIFHLQFRLEISKLFTSFFCWKLAVATTALNFEHIYFCCTYFVRSFCADRPWADIKPSSHFLYQVILTLLVNFIFCVSHSNLHNNFLLQSCLNFVSLFIALPYSGYHLLFFLGRVPIKPLDFACLFWAFKHDSWWFDHPCCCSSNCSG
jgi:hypothetical protein